MQSVENIQNVWKTSSNDPGVTGGVEMVENIE